MIMDLKGKVLIYNYNKKGKLAILFIGLEREILIYL